MSETQERMFTGKREAPQRAEMPAIPPVRGSFAIDNRFRFGCLRDESRKIV